MNILLVIITFASLAVAAGMSFVVLRMVREERQRSDARASALADLVAGDDPDRDAVEPPLTIRPVRRASQPVRRPAAPAVAPEPGADDRDLELHRDGSAAAGLFVVPERRSPWPGRAAIIGGLAVVLACVALLLLPSRHGSAGTGQIASAAPTPAPLELLSLRHVQEGHNLTISGLVQNPRNGMPLSQVTATAFLFSADGSFLTSGRAPLDFTTLRAGDESPFVIKVPVTDAVARYRVSFRDETGRVIGHVDRRNNSAVARVE